MFKYIFLILLLSVLAAPGICTAGKGELELKDGSVIRGEIVSASGGVYRIKTDSLGVISVEESKIRNIRLGEGSNGTSGKGASGLIDSQAIDALKDRLMNDEEMMSRITALANDPGFQEIMNDPEILKAVAGNDVQALLSNPKFKRALENQKIKEIERKLGQ